MAGYEPFLTSEESIWQASPITRTDGFQLHIWLCILESIQDFNFRFDIQTTNVCTEIGPIKVSKSQKEIVVSPHTPKTNEIFHIFLSYRLKRCQIERK